MRKYEFDECPYCGTDIKPIMDMHDPLNQDEETEIECKCGKMIIVQATYTVDYYCYEAPCLNGGEHQFKPIVGHPKEYFEGKLRCEHCNKEIKVKEV